MRSVKAMSRLIIPILSGLVLVLPILSGWAAPELAAQAKRPGKAPAKSAPSKAVAPASQAPREIPVVRRRDPFEPLIARGGGRGADIPECAGVGKAGLVVATVRLDGVVQSANGMIAVVANPQNRVYFLREGDRLCNGAVERISMEGVTFRERGKDPFGNPLDRVVAKRLYPSAGEQR
jgi:hypothetical protein